MTLRYPYPYDRLKTLALLITSLRKPPKLKSSSLTLQEDTKVRSSEKHYALLWKDLLDHFNSTEETLVKKLRPSESLDMPSKLSIY
jgi:hypothetical protein